MTLTQLEYIVSVHTFQSFGIAAEKCFVTQPTLSMQIQKLEEELGVKLFDRSKKPVITTEIGLQIIQQARDTLNTAYRIKEIIKEQETTVSGHLRLGVIPTLAPYLLPLFLPHFLETYPSVKLSISEMTTEGIVAHLKNNLLDIGLLVTPLNDGQIREKPLFYEPFVSYLSRGHVLSDHMILRIDQLEQEDIWLLNEGHCLRSQILNLCHKQGGIHPNFDYQTGSLETLRRMVETTGGITILPELSIKDFGVQQMDRVRYFDEPEPVREVSLVTHRDLVKAKLIQVFTEMILKHIPEKMKNLARRNIVPVHSN